jgi:hypothetical protein
MPGAKDARISFADEVITVGLRRVDPVDEPSGQAARLANLGFYAGPLDGGPTPELEQAILMFQIAQGLPYDGKANQKTKDALVAAHGS